MGPATVILMFFSAVLAISGCLIYNKWRKATGSVGESVAVTILGVIIVALAFLFMFNCSVTIYTNTWDFGWRQ